MKYPDSTAIFRQAFARDVRSLHVDHAADLRSAVTLGFLRSKAERFFPADHPPLTAGEERALLNIPHPTEVEIHRAKIWDAIRTRDSGGSPRSIFC